MSLYIDDPAQCLTLGWHSGIHVFLEKYCTIETVKSWLLVSSPKFLTTKIWRGDDQLVRLGEVRFLPLSLIRWGVGGLQGVADKTGKVLPLNGKKKKIGLRFFFDIHISRI